MVNTLASAFILEVSLFIALYKRRTMGEIKSHASFETTTRSEYDITTFAVRKDWLCTRRSEGREAKRSRQPTDASAKLVLPTVVALDQDLTFEDIAISEAALGAITDPYASGMIRKPCPPLANKNSIESVRRKDEGGIPISAKKDHPQEILIA